MAEQAWQGKEFLASTDEGFRPVYLTSGPDGSMYVVDMHRGVIQHHAFLSPYLKKRAKEAQLDTIIHSGRILKISPASLTNKQTPNLDKMSADELVHLLSSKNGYLRDQAQHRLVYKQMSEAIGKLTQLAHGTENPIAQIHALNTLNGLDKGGLDLPMLLNVAKNSRPDVVAHALVFIEKYVDEGNNKQVRDIFQVLLSKKEKGIDLYLATTLGVWANAYKEDFLPLFEEIKNRYSGNEIIQEAFISGIGDFNFDQDELKLSESDSLLVQHLEKNSTRRNENKPNPIFVRKGSGQDSRTKGGAKLYRQICAACHQADGTGAEGLAPPLVDSEHILPSEKLGLIILHGLRGPIEVNGTMYDMNHAMPGLNTNATLSDKDISALVSYVTNAFSKYPKGLGQDKVKELRKVSPPKEDGGFTIEELDETIKTIK